MRFTSLGSGSSGNALLVRSRACCLMVDCGFSLREVERRLASRGVDARDLDAVLVTHEHGDHAGGVAAVARRYGLRVYATAGTIKAARLEGLDAKVLVPECAERIGDIEVMPVTVPHDAREPSQFVFQQGGRRLGVLTDLGSLSNLVREHYHACDALVLECNHDDEMLALGPYPYPLKQRVGGAWGHLSNAQAAEFVAGLELGGLQHLVAAHLSEQNNRPEKARDALAPLLQANNNLVVADQVSGFDWLTVE